MKALISILVLSVLSNHAFAEAQAGDAEKEQLRSSISVHTNEMRICYKDNQKTLKGAEGKIYFEFEVNDQSALVNSGVNKKKTTLKNEALSQCVLEKAKAWMYPAAPKGTTVKVTYPFAFTKIKD